MKKSIILSIIVILVGTLLVAPVNADCKFSHTDAKHGDMSGKTVVAGLLSFLIWPGIGQYMNDCEKDKNITHAVLGITGIYRFWSGWDALIERRGGYWKGRI